MGQVSINGKIFNVPNNSNVTIRNNQVFVDGKQLEHPDLQLGDVKITGNVNQLQTDGSAEISGNVGGNVSAGGSVHCSDVGGKVHAGGSVHCENVQGDVTAGGSVRAEVIHGRSR